MNNSSSLLEKNIKINNSNIGTVFVMISIVFVSLVSTIIILKYRIRNRDKISPIVNPKDVKVEIDYKKFNKPKDYLMEILNDIYEKKNINKNIPPLEYVNNSNKNIKFVKTIKKVKNIRLVKKDKIMNDKKIDNNITIKRLRAAKRLRAIKKINRIKKRKIANLSINK